MFCTSLVRSGTFTGHCSILLDQFLSRPASVEKCPCSNGCCRFRTLFPTLFFSENYILKITDVTPGILNKNVGPGGFFGVISPGKLLWGHQTWLRDTHLTPPHLWPSALLHLPKDPPRPERGWEHPLLSGDDGGILG